MAFTRRRRRFRKKRSFRRRKVFRRFGRKGATNARKSLARVGVIPETVRLFTAAFTAFTAAWTRDDEFTVAYFGISNLVVEGASTGDNVRPHDSAYFYKIEFNMMWTPEPNFIRTAAYRDTTMHFFLIVIRSGTPAVWWADYGTDSIMGPLSLNTDYKKFRGCGLRVLRHWSIKPSSFANTTFADPNLTGSNIKYYHKLSLSHRWGVPHKVRYRDSGLRSAEDAGNLALVSFQAVDTNNLANYKLATVGPEKSTMRMYFRAN